MNDGTVLPKPPQQCAVLQQSGIGSHLYALTRCRTAMIKADRHGTTAHTIDTEHMLFSFQNEDHDCADASSESQRPSRKPPMVVRLIAESGDKTK